MSAGEAIWENDQVRTTEDAWSAFIKSRFEALATRKLTVGPTIQSRMLDLELSMLKKYTRVAKQYRNAFSGAAALPAEILATIFTFAQVGWQPWRSLHPAPHFGLGWMAITHVCSVWRRMAFGTPSLWTTVRGPHVPPRMLTEFVRRSRNSSLKLHVDTWLCNEMLSIDSWLCEPVLNRSAHVSINAQKDKELFTALSLLKSTSPLPKLYNLSVNYASTNLARSLFRLEDDTFNLKAYPALRKLSLRNCFPAWRGSLPISKSLTHLTLGMVWHSEDGDLENTFRPSAPIFRDMLARLPLLTELTLENFLPSPARALGPDGFEVNANLGKPMILRERLRRLSVQIDNLTTYECKGNYFYFWNNLQLHPTTVVVVDLSIDFFDEVMEDDEDGDFLLPVTSVDSTVTSILEMTLSRHTLSLRYAESPEDTWTRCSNIETFERPAWSNTTNWVINKDCLDDDVVHGSRHLCVPGDVTQNIKNLSLGSLRALFVVSNVMLSFSTPDAWITSFAQAQNVQRLSFAYPASLPLLAALSRTNSGPGDALPPSIFPQLDSLILHAESDPSRENTFSRQAALELTLMDVLAVRKNIGSPILQIYVDKRMEEWEVWAKLEDGVVVSFFERLARSAALYTGDE